MVAETYDPGPIVQMYANLAAVLAGFALAGLVLYLERQRRDDGETTVERSSAASPQVITTTLFYSMAALTTCAFLYSTLAGEPHDSARAAIGRMLYGIVFGLSVLSLFFALVLVMLGHPVTQAAARRTSWVVVVAGPAIVFRFLASAAGDAWALGCRGNNSRACTTWLLAPRSWAAIATVVIIGVSMILTVSWARQWQPFRAFLVLTRRIRPWRPQRPLPRLLRRALRPLASERAEQLFTWPPGLWFLTRPWAMSVAGFCRHRPVLPATIAFSSAAVVGVGSVWMEIPATSGPPPMIANVVLLVAVALNVLFAVAADSVLDPHPRRESVRAVPADRPARYPSAATSSSSR